MCIRDRIFGLALLTKVNAMLLPLALWPWGLYFHRRRALRAILSMCTAGPVIFFVGWPWLWMHPVGNFAEYIIDKFPRGFLPSFVLKWTGTEEIGWRTVARTLYFGKVDPGGAPWHYPFVMFFITLPAAALLGGVASFVAAKRSPQKRGLAALLWWSILVQLAVFAFLMTPFDGLRLFLPVLPLAAMAAGMGLSWLGGRGRLALAAVLVVTALSPGVEFFMYEPYGMSYFSPLVGALPGAERLGMEVTYYGEAVAPEGLVAINSRATAGEKVAYGPMFKELPWRMPYEYIRNGHLKLGLEAAAPWEDWDYFIFINRGGNIDESDIANLARGEVIHENRLLGVTLSKILARKRVSQGGHDASGLD